MSVTEPRWLERLARRAAGHDRGTPPVRIVDSGLSRRTALRAAGATVLIAGSLRGLTAPPAARADGFSDCIKYHNQANYDTFQKCVQGPSDAYDHYEEAITHAENALSTTKSKAKKARLQLIIKQARNGQHQAIQKIMDCNAEYAHNRAFDLDGCRIQNPPPPTDGGGGGGGASVGTSGCPSGTIRCAQSGPVLTCCYGSDTCCSCAGGITCCIYNDCRCCG